MNITADFKTRDARKWLLDGMKVKVTIRFRGREITYPEIALEDLKEIAEVLADIAVVEIPPSMEGRVMNMVLTPSKYVKKKTPGETTPAVAINTGTRSGIVILILEW